MKSFKKVLCTLLSLVMAVAVCVPSLAFGTDTTYKLTISDAVDTHTYKIYQIFTGTVSWDTTQTPNEATLSDIAWGTGVSETGQSALKTLLGLESTDAATVAATIRDKNAATTGQVTVRQVAQKLAETDNLTSTCTSKTGAEMKTGLSLAPGYYMVVDTNATTPTPTSDSFSSYIVCIVGPTTTTIKNTDIPTATKTASNSQTGTYASSTTASMGDKVYFTLTAALPTTVSSYAKGYKLVFTDTLPDGLYNTTSTGGPSIKSVTVTHSGTATTKTTGYGTDFNSTTGVFTITIDNVTADTFGATDGDTITIVYEATVDTDATVGSTGNANSMVLTYSNNPETTATGTLSATAATVYTYMADIVKVKSDRTLLGGTTTGSFAEFKLYNAATGGNEIKLAYDSTNKYYYPSATGDATIQALSGQAVIKGLGNGTYYLEEVTAPSGYNKLTSRQAFTISSADLAASVTSGTVAENTGVQVVNQAGVILPTTGGVGTVIFTIVGLVIICAAGVGLVIRYRRRQAQD